MNREPNETAVLGVRRHARSIADAHQMCVLQALAELSDGEMVCCEAPNVIALIGRVSPTSLKPILEKLEFMGFIKRLQQGNGRGKYSSYQVFPKGDAPQEGAQSEERVAENRPLSRKTSLSTALSPDSSRERGVDNTPLANPNIETGARARLEGVDVFHTSTPDAVDVSGANAPTPAPTAASPPDISPDLLALYDITGLLPGICGPKKTSELKTVIGALRAKPMTPTSPSATPENIRLFAEKWRALSRGRPYPGQVFTHWDEVLCPIATPETEVTHGTNQYRRLEKRPQSAVAQRGEERVEQLNGLNQRREELEARKREMAERNGARTPGREAPVGA